MGTRFIEYIKTIHEEGTPEFDSCALVIRNIQSLGMNTVELSDIVFLGFLLGSNITAYDPTCRPVYVGKTEVEFDLAKIGQLGPSEDRKTWLTRMPSKDGDERKGGRKQKCRRTRRFARRSKVLRLKKSRKHK